MTRVGLAGAGTMGFLAARLLLEAGEQLAVYDVSPAAVARVTALGGKPAASPQALSAQAEIVLLFLPGPPQIEAVVAGDDGLLAAARSGQIIVDLSTSSPQTTIRLGAAAAAQGVAFLDAPILGRPSAAGHWVLPVGGDEATLARARPVLERLGSVTLVGGPGAGHTLKLLNALMFNAINAMTAEMMAIARRSAIDPAVLYETIAGSQAATVSGLFRESGRKIVEREFSPTFTIDMLWKDNGLALQLARDLGAKPLLASAVQSLNEAARDYGLGAEDSSALVKLYEALEAQRATVEGGLEMK